MLIVMKTRDIWELKGAFSNISSSSSSVMSGVESGDHGGGEFVHDLGVGMLS